MTSERKNLIKSTQTQYYFDPKLVTLGKPKFDPHLIGDRITEEEFLMIREKLISAGGLDLWLKKWLFTVTVLLMTILLMCYLTPLLRSRVQFQHNLMKDIFVCCTIVVAATVVGLCSWMRASAKAHKKIEDKLLETNISYMEKGVQWKVTHDLKFMHVHMTKGGKYLPPNPQTISLTLYENSSQPLQQGDDSYYATNL